MRLLSTCDTSNDRKQMSMGINTVWVHIAICKTKNKNLLFKDQKFKT